MVKVRSGKLAQLDQVIAPAVHAVGLEYIGCEMQTQGNRTLLRIYISRDEGGVSVSDCEQASKQIAAVLDVEDSVSGGYNLEVSSPGFDRPLFTEEHFRQFIGQTVKIRLAQSKDGRRNYKGVIQTVENGNVGVVLEEGETCVLAFRAIDKANLVTE